MALTPEEQEQRELYAAILEYEQDHVCPCALPSAAGLPNQRQPLSLCPLLPGTQKGLRGVHGLATFPKAGASLMTGSAQLPVCVVGQV